MLDTGWFTAARIQDTLPLIAQALEYSERCYLTGGYMSPRIEAQSIKQISMLPPWPEKWPIQNSALNNVKYTYLAPNPNYKAYEAV